jgi:hypothetical protein
MVPGDEVAFHACLYDQLQSVWGGASSNVVRAHAAAIATLFGL